MLLFRISCECKENNVKNINVRYIILITFYGSVPSVVKAIENLK